MAWTINSIRIYVFDFSEMEAENVVIRSPVGEDTALPFWFSSYRTYRAGAWVTPAEYAAAHALGRGNTYAFAGPGGLAATIMLTGKEWRMVGNAGAVLGGVSYAYLWQAILSMVLV